MINQKRKPILLRKLHPKWQAKFKSHRHYEIKHDPSVGFYLYVFDGNRCIRDYLQDTLEIAIECAWEDFGLPKDAWEKIS